MRSEMESKQNPPKQNDDRIENGMQPLFRLP